MTDNRIAKQHHATFEGIRHVDADGNDFWLARKLAEVLDYSQFRHFLPVIERAKEACRNSGQALGDHIEDILTMVDIGSGAKRQVEDFRLSRYAGRRKAKARPGTRQATRQPDAFRGRSEGTRNDQGPGRHDAGSTANPQGRHPADREHQTKTGQSNIILEDARIYWAAAR
jgi:hypothetical protein